MPKMPLMAIMLSLNSELMISATFAAITVFGQLDISDPKASHWWS